MAAANLLPICSAPHKPRKKLRVRNVRTKQAPTGSTSKWQESKANHPGNWAAPCRKTIPSLTHQKIEAARKKRLKAQPKKASGSMLRSVLEHQAVD